MYKDNTVPSEIKFWKNRIKDRSLLSALDMFPEYANDIFGVVPVMRRNVLQLSIILGAREILAERRGRSKSLRDLRNDDKLQALIMALPPKKRSIALAALNPKQQEKITKDFARMIIKEATGKMP